MVVVGAIASNKTKRKLVALHQYTPSASRVISTSVRKLLTLSKLGEDSLILIVLVSMISMPSLYQVMFGGGELSVAHSRTRSWPADAFTDVKFLPGNVGATKKKRGGWRTSLKILLSKCPQIVQTLNCQCC